MKNTKPYTEEMDVTPEMAVKWLEGNVHNRRFDESLAQRYARDMGENRWYFTHQGICFDPQMTLIDGQHRLWGVVISGKAVRMNVSFNYPLESQVAVDDHKPRSVATALSLAGYGVTNLHVSVARCMMQSFEVKQIFGKQQIKDFCEQHKDAIEFGVTCFRQPRRFVSRAPIRAALARAWYTQDRERLKLFAEILLDGIPEDVDRDRAAISLRNLLLSTVKRSGGIDGRVLIYAKTQRAIQAFLAGEPLDRVVVAPHELFPLPGESSPTRRISVRRTKKDIAVRATRKKLAKAMSA